MTFKPALLAFAAFSCVTAAQASIYTFTGDTTGAPTFDRPLEDLSDYSAIGTDVNYTTFEFTVSAAGDYTFLTTGEFDTFVVLYEMSFDPSNSLTNAIAANDDLFVGPFTTSAILAPLETGTMYTLVTTGFESSEFGAFSTTIGGPGQITLVPEPETFAMLAFGLGVLGFARRYASTRSA